MSSKKKRSFQTMISEDKDTSNSSDSTYDFNSIPPPTKRKIEQTQQNGNDHKNHTSNSKSNTIKSQPHQLSSPKSNSNSNSNFNVKSTSKFKPKSKSKLLITSLHESMSIKGWKFTKRDRNPSESIIHNNKLYHLNLIQSFNLRQFCSNRLNIF